MPLGPPFPPVWHRTNLVVRPGQPLFPRFIREPGLFGRFRRSATTIVAVVLLLQHEFLTRVAPRPHARHHFGTMTAARGRPRPGSERRPAHPLYNNKYQRDILCGRNLRGFDDITLIERSRLVNNTIHTAPLPSLHPPSPTSRVRVRLG